MRAVLEGNFKETSPFGWRVHPVTKEKKMHNGVDLAGVPKGNSVTTPSDGIVKISALSNSAGNWIHIAKNNLTFIFMHLDSRAVKVGDIVKKGQEIGKVGTTGMSTGIHLHFEVRENGTPINPKNFIYYETTT